MPRRNYYILIGVLVVSLVCHARSKSSYLADLVTEAQQLIERDYVEPVDRRELIDATLRGLTTPLDDYSTYISPDDYRAFQEGMDQRFGGIGIQVSLDPDTGQLVVTSPLVGTPAFKAGMMPGDVILEIDGESTEEFTLEDAVKRMRGEPGSPVRLTILHPGETERREIELRRAVIAVESVLGDVRKSDGTWSFFLEGARDIGYIRVAAFNEKTIEEFAFALLQLRTQQGMRALILDLRDNPGGLLKAAVQMCDLFIDEGKIVTVQGRRGRDSETHYASREDSLTEFPLVVLVNGFSASASEIVAACLQDHGRAVVIGERTWGKASVQVVEPLSDGQSALKLTIAHYTRPNGANIHRRQDATDADQWGVRPNEGFEVPLDDQQRRERIRVRRERDAVHRHGYPPEVPRGEAYWQTDPPLLRAVEHLRGVLDQRPTAEAESPPRESG